MFQHLQYGNYSPTLGSLVSSGVKIFDESWSTYVPEHKNTLIEKIIKHYYFNQIGSETPDRFIFYINAQLAEIMPYYNQLYASELIKFNPLLNHYIQTNGRTTENLLTKANTTDDKFAKAIRDFAGMTDKTGNGAVKATGVGTTSRDTNNADTYNKNGNEKIEEKMNDSVKETEIVDGTKNTTGHTDKTANNKTTTIGHTSIDKNVEFKPDETTAQTTDYGQTEKSDKDLTGKVIGSGTGTKNWTETKDDDATTKIETNLQENSSGSGTDRYSDTPQKSLATGPDGEVILTNYLTNARWTSETSQHKADTTQDTTFKDDETRTHDENATNSNSTDTTEKTGTTKTLGGSDTTTTTKTGKNIENTTELQDVDKTETFNQDEDIDVTEDVVSHEDSTIEKTETRGTEIDKSWEEHGGSKQIGEEVVKSSTNNDQVNNTTGREESHELSNLSNSSVQNTEKRTEETTDTGTTQIASGYMNISASALLEAFRRTFLNIDQQIIEELKNNFMLVY